MLDNEGLPTLSEILIRQRLFFSRSDVQHQSAIILLCLMVSWLLSNLLWRWLHHRFPQSTTFAWGDSRLPVRQYGAVLLQTLDFPIISLVSLNIFDQIFRYQDWTRGLIGVALQLMRVYLGYRFFLATLYSIFSPKKVRNYQSRLLTPLLILFILRTIIGLYNDIEQLAKTSPFNLFNSPVSIGSIFWLIAGIYFWTVIVFLLEDIWFTIFRAKTQVELGTMEATLILLRYFLIALGIVIVLGYIGVDGKAIAAITGGLSIGIGFGLQQVVSNFVCGILLLFEGALKPGDMISVEGDTCQVKKLGVRATRVLKLIDNSEKIIPNQTFFTSNVTTYTGSDHLVNCSIKIGVGYDSSAQQVIELLLETAQQHVCVLKEPEPLAFFLDFGDSSLNFELKFWLNDINIKKRVTSDLNCLILECFNNHNIEIPFPQQDLHIRTKTTLPG